MPRPRLIALALLTGVSSTTLLFAQDTPIVASTQTQRETNASTSSTGPATQPARIERPAVTHPLPELVHLLSSSDPAIRESAQQELMLLERDDLTDLLAAVRGMKRLSAMQIALLRDVVCHVYLTEVHRFSGPGTGFLGISAPPQFATDAVIPGRVIGYDAYRVLRDGDTIVGIQLDAEGSALKPISTFQDILELMKSTVPGEWMLVRIIRNGQPLEVTLRLASRDQNMQQGAGSVNPRIGMAQQYWNQTFAPVVAPPTTKPAR